jgi:hypothetical protein
LKTIENIKAFFNELKENIVLGYIWILTLILIFLYSVIFMIFGAADSFPVPFEIPNIQGVIFILLMSFSFFLIVIFFISLNKGTFEKIRENRTLLYLIIIHVLTLIISLFLPIGIFAGVFIIAYFLWYIVSALFIVIFLQDISLSLSIKIITKSKTIGLVYYFIWWILGFIIFGIIYILLDWGSLNLLQQIPLLAFPLFIIILPIIGLIIKQENRIKPPVTFFGILLFFFVLYHWFRYLNWTQTEVRFTLIDAIIDIVIISYSFITLFKNAKAISDRMNGKINVNQLLLLFIWTRMTSMIILFALPDQELFGITAAEGVYLLTMFLIFLVGFIYGILWLRKGINQEQIDIGITIPDFSVD